MVSVFMIATSYPYLLSFNSERPVILSSQTRLCRADVRFEIRDRHGAIAAVVEVDDMALDAARRDALPRRRLDLGGCAGLEDLLVHVPLKHQMRIVAASLRQIVNRPQADHLGA